MQSPEQYACKYSDTKSDYFRQPLQVKMSGVESSGVTLALVDSSLLSCWEEMIKQGKECSLVLKHNKGKVTTTLQSTSCLPHPSLSASNKTRKKASKKKRLEGLLAYHQRLVEERGLPPSRLMLQQAAAASSPFNIPSKPEPWPQWGAVQVWPVWIFLQIEGRFESSQWKATQGFTVAWKSLWWRTVSEPRTTEWKQRSRFVISQCWQFFNFSPWRILPQWDSNEHLLPQL